LGLLLVASSYAQQDDPRFTGKSTVMEGKELTAARRHFEAGARSAWHSHDKGQLLMVEEGRMRTQKKGGAVRELAVHDSDYTGPNVVHWHGATPDQPLVQINVGFGGDTKWMDKVTDGEYNAK
jgi:4-carboxymuconolactone decarboxylase